MRASDEQYMMLAVEEAAEARRRGDMPFGAVIVDENADVVLSRAHSSELSDGDITAHAELKAIRQASRILSRLELDGLTLFASGEPCTMCASAIFHAKINRVVIAAQIAGLEPRASHIETQSRFGTETCSSPGGSSPRSSRTLAKICPP